ncbi:MAG: hypothetical protein IBJ18_03230 [Phycisphaerales bacterium]|nr:hypothetical protein [Phycisphaerales bacterium]
MFNTNRRKVLPTVFAGCLVVVGTAAPIFAQTPSYAATVLAPSGSVDTFFYGAGGAIAVGTAEFPAIGSPFPDARNAHAILWNSATSSFTDLHPEGFSGSYAFSARNGQQVGYGFIGQGNRALLWTGSAASMVDLTASYMDSATLTDTDGQFQVGGAITPNSEGSSVAFIWNGTAESAVQIHPVILAESYAYAIRDGRIAGTGSDFDFMQLGVYWPSATAEAILVRPSGYDETSIVDIVGPWAVGTGTGFATGGPRHAILWDPINLANSVDIHPTGNPAYINSYPAKALSTGPGPNDFIIVGSVAVETSPGSGETLEHACVWIGPSTFIDLHSTVPAGYVLSKATGIDSNGNIYGWATDLAASSDYIAIRWSPVTAPASCNPADIACDDGTPLAQAPGCTNSTTGPNEGDYNAFFSAEGFFFQAGQGTAGIGGTCDIACDDGNARSTNPGCTNNGVNEGDYNCFFNNLFLPCV